VRCPLAFSLHHHHQGALRCPLHEFLRHSTVHYTDVVQPCLGMLAELEAMPVTRGVFLVCVCVCVLVVMLLWNSLSSGSYAATGVANQKGLLQSTLHGMEIYTHSPIPPPADR